MSSKILVIGGTGLVGNALVREWERRGSEVAAATYNNHPTRFFRRLDMQDGPSVESFLKEYRPSWVAVPAANPFVDYCELHPVETRKVNVEGTLNVARACKQVGARMIFYSSDYVFDGLKGEYREDDKPNPINEYGRQKAEVEEKVLKESSDNLILRTAGAYGWQWEPKNFVLQVRAKLSANKPMEVAGDVRYNPTSADNLASITVELVEKGCKGIYHVVGADRLTRFDFARRIAKAFKLDPALLKEVPSSHFSPPAKRPKESSLITEKVRTSVKLPLWGVDQGLSHMLSSEAAWRAYASERLPSVAFKA